MMALGVVLSLALASVFWLASLLCDEGRQQTKYERRASVCLLVATLSLIGGAIWHLS